MLHELAGGDDQDPASAHKSFYYSPQYYGNLNELKIGYAEIDFAEWPAEALRPAFAQALSVVKSLGSQIWWKPNCLTFLMARFSCIIDSEGASVFEQLIRSGQVDQLADQGQIDGLKASMNYSAIDYLKSMRVRTQIQAEFRKLFTNVDLLVAPTKLDLPDKADGPFDDTTPKRPDVKGVFAGLVQASNLCGMPALTVPCGFVNGLPIGLQIVGRPFSENRILALAVEFQKRTNFISSSPVRSPLKRAGVLLNTAPARGNQEKQKLRQ